MGNFEFLSSHPAIFLQLARGAERTVHADPNASLIKMRQLSEAMARHACASLNIFTGQGARQLDHIDALEQRGILKGDVDKLFHALRVAGNRAAHDFVGTRATALQHLGLTFRLACWFHKSFGGDAAKGFKSPAFVEPRDAEAEHADKDAELRRVQAELEATRQRADTEAARREAAEHAASCAAQDSAIYAQLAEETEAALLKARREFDERLKETQQAAEAAPKQVQAQSALATKEATKVKLTEAETRAVIDAQLVKAGWEADTVRLRHANGARPVKGANRAIAEWPTASGPADYVLFAGLQPLGVVEAKKQETNIPGSLEQSKRYSRTFGYSEGMQPPVVGEAAADFDGWDAGTEAGKPQRYRVPFLYATNGRPYLRQVEQASGVWFLDARRKTNHPHALTQWHTPQGLLERLAQDEVGAAQKLKEEPTGYLGLRDYQLNAIAAVEAALAQGKGSMLVAMATGTGKTRTVIGLIYRLLKTQRFRRVLFLVDRTSLGTQAQDAFKEMRLEQNQLFTEIYEVREIGDIKPEKETRVHVATVQGMVRRVLDEEGPQLAVDAYDCVIVDEAHRGYVLDKEMNEGEMQVRDQAAYISSYRRVLDHFDAVKVGLTATPALHTRQIFGDPVFEYAYPRAVADGWLVDHEPPLQIRTHLSDEGIRFAEGEQVQVLQQTGQLDLWNVEEDIRFDVEDFHRKVITENFNRAVCGELAKHLDPHSDEKTLIFCLNDAHADLVVTLLTQALESVHGPIEEGTVIKVTSKADDPDHKILLLKVEKNPRVAVTVDLLSTGVDVPRICNLVFLRRVRSRILYEQMMGRATRRCDEIGKQVFRIFDAVGLYSAMQTVTEMKPVVQQVYTPMEELVGELLDPASLTTPGTQPDTSHAQDVLAQVLARIRRLARKRAGGKLDEERKAAVDAFEEVAGKPLEQWAHALNVAGAAEAARMLGQNPALAQALVTAGSAGGESVGLYVSEHPDHVTSVQHGYGPGNQRPKDYLDSFGEFIRSNENRLTALNVVIQRPRELTRKQLQELRLALDAAGYSETALRTAHRDVTNVDVAAGIVGFIRQRALGSTLEPYARRVERAVERVLALKAWTVLQRKWLERIGKQLKEDVVLERQAFEVGAFKDHGGLAVAERVFEGRLAEVLAQVVDAVWEDRVA